MRPLWLRRRATVRLRYRGGNQAHPFAIPALVSRAMRWLNELLAKQLADAIEAQRSARNDA